MQHKKILFAAAVMMASVVMFTGCASQEIQDRKAASEAAAIAAAQPTATPAPTPAPTPEPINAWSLLDNLPEFAVGTLDKPDMTWTDGLPLGVNPLTYEDGAFVSGLYSSASGSSTQIKSVSVKDLNEMPISGYLKLSVLETGETVIDSIEDAVTGEGLEKDISDFCVCTEGENGESANYYQIGFNGGPVSNVMDSTTAAADGMTIGNAFENGLFYSTMKPSALKDFPADGTPEEKFNALYAVFGTPNGLYWKNSPTGTQYTSFDEFRDAEYNKETGAKSFYLVWNYEDCTVVASCSDQFDSADVKGTAITDIYEFPVLQGTEYINEASTDTFWGYLGYGDAPVRLTGLYATMPGAPAEDAAAVPESDTATESGAASDDENAANSDAAASESSDSSSEAVNSSITVQ